MKRCGQPISEESLALFTLGIQLCYSIYNCQYLKSVPCNTGFLFDLRTLSTYTEVFLRGLWLCGKSRF